MRLDLNFSFFSGWKLLVSIQTSAISEDMYMVFAIPLFLAVCPGLRQRNNSYWFLPAISFCCEDYTVSFKSKWSFWRSPELIFYSVFASTPSTRDELGMLEATSLPIAFTACLCACCPNLSKRFWSLLKLPASFPGQHFPNFTIHLLKKYFLLSPCGWTTHFLSDAFF